MSNFGLWYDDDDHESNARMRMRHSSRFEVQNVPSRIVSELYGLSDQRIERLVVGMPADVRTTVKAFFRNFPRGLRVSDADVYIQEVCTTRFKDNQYVQMLVRRGYEQMKVKYKGRLASDNYTDAHMYVLYEVPSGKDRDDVVTDQEMVCRLISKYRYTESLIANKIGVSVFVVRAVGTSGASLSFEAKSKLAACYNAESSSASFGL